MIIRSRLKQIRQYLGVGTSSNLQFENSMIKKGVLSPIIPIERILAISYNDSVMYELSRFGKPHDFVTLEPIELFI